MVTFHAEGPGAVRCAGERHPNLAGCVGLDPECGVRGADMAQQRPEDEVGSHAEGLSLPLLSHVKPRDRAMTGIKPRNVEDDAGADQRPHLLTWWRCVA